jgi:hypothetical protein
LVQSQGMGKAKPKEKDSNPADEQELRAEIEAFTAQLGLGASTGGGFDDRDFRPDLGKTRLGAKAAKPAAKRPAATEAAVHQIDRVGVKRHKAAAAPAPARGGGQAHGTAAGSKAAAADAPQAVKGRAWKASVGPRPGLTRSHAEIAGLPTHLRGPRVGPGLQCAVQQMDDAVGGSSVPHC